MKKSYINIYASFVVFSLFGIVIPLISTQGATVSGMGYFYMIVVYTSCRLSIIIWSQRLRILEVTFFVFTYVFLGLVPLFQIQHHTFPWGGGIYDYDMFSYAGIIVLLGVVSYDLGLYLSRFAKNKQKDISVSKKPNYSLILILGICAFLLGVLMYGGIQNLFIPRNELTSVIGADISSNLVSGAILKVPIFIATVFLLWKLTNKNDKRVLLKSNLILYSFLVLSILLTLIASNPISSSRYWFGTVCLSLLFIFLKWKLHTQTIIIFSLMFLLLIVFPYADVFRNSVNFDVEVENFSTTFTENGDFDAFQQVLNIQTYTDRYGFTNGNQLLGSFLFFIPRDIWPEKPIGTGATSAEALGYNFTNVSAPLWVEFYVNFGLIGVMCLFILYGWASGKLQKIYVKHKENKIVSFYTVFVPIYAAYQLFLLRGDLLSSWANLAPVIFFVLIGIKPKLLKKRYKLTF